MMRKIGKTCWWSCYLLMAFCLCLPSPPAAIATGPDDYGTGGGLIVSSGGSDVHYDGFDLTGATDIILESQSQLPTASPFISLDAPVEEAAVLTSDGIDWRTGSNAPWAEDSTVAHAGSTSLRSGRIGHDQESWLETTVTGPAVIAFRWKVSSENFYDFLKIFVDGDDQDRISGEEGWARNEVAVSGFGEHVLRFVYSKDGSLVRGADAAWIDEVTISRQVDEDGDGLPGVSEMDNCPTVANPGQEDCDRDAVGDACDPDGPCLDTDGDGLFDLFDNCPAVASAIQNDSDGDGTGDACDACPEDFSKVEPGLCGCGMVDFDTDGDGLLNCVDNCLLVANPDQADRDGDQAGDACDANPETVDTLGPAVGNAAISWSTGGDAPWFVDDTRSFFGATSLRSGPIGPRQESWLETTVDGPAFIFFVWRISSEFRYGVLSVSVDNVPWRITSGDNDYWMLKSGVINGAGPHVIRWTYRKSASVTRGVDAGWIDEVVVVPLDDTDGDGWPDIEDYCPESTKGQPGQCGCDVPDTDTDADGVADCMDNCPIDPAKTFPGVCGCDTPETDSDWDDVPDCQDGCPRDWEKTTPGACGCGVEDTDGDNDGVSDCLDECPWDSFKSTLGVCGCGRADIDSDGDSMLNCVDNCPSVANPDQADRDGDQTGDACDVNPDALDVLGQAVGNAAIPWSTGGSAPWFVDSAAGHSGETSLRSGAIRYGQESWLETTVNGPARLSFWLKVSSAGCCYNLEIFVDNVQQFEINHEIGWEFEEFVVSGAGAHKIRWTYKKYGPVIETDAGWLDEVTVDPLDDTDGDGWPDIMDSCPGSTKGQPGQCGCDIPDTDSDGDGVADCVDSCPNDWRKTTPGGCGCGVYDYDRDWDRVPDCLDGCPSDRAKTLPGVCGCGVADVDSDNDGVFDCLDVCPADSGKTTTGICGCGMPDVDTDGDGLLDCLDSCQDDPANTCSVMRSCQEILAASPGAASGVYRIDPNGSGFFFSVYCDMATDNGGWTLVASTRDTTLNDQASAYYSDLATIAPMAGHEGVWDGLRSLPGMDEADMRFSCGNTSQGMAFDVDLSFRAVPWYLTITSGTDADSRFEWNGYDQPQQIPGRRNNLTGAELPAGDQWNAGALEIEDYWGDTADFTVDFDDRGMDSDEYDGTDWGEDDTSKKCGASGLAGGRWFIWVREKIDVGSSVVPLAISALSFADGSIDGGTAVIISGSGFGLSQGNGSVSIGGVSAIVTGWSASQIIILTPAHNAGLVDVVVSADNGQVATVANGFRYAVPDCLGVLDGAATTDNCGWCDTDPANDCVQDCAGIWGGMAVFDSCGVCDADLLNDCLPSVESLGRVLINEIHYDQRSREQEYIELLVAEGPIDLTGWTLTDMDEESIAFNAGDSRFPCGVPFVLDQGDLLVVWQGSGQPVCSGPVKQIFLNTGTFLQRDGDDIALLDAAGNCVDYVAYEQGWNWGARIAPPPDCAWNEPNQTNGNRAGISISRLDADPVVDTDSGSDWEASGAIATNAGLSPGERNAQPTTEAAGRVLINEIHYDQRSGEQEFVELYAPVANQGPVDLAGWRLKDMDEMEFVFANILCPQPFALNPGDRLTIWQGSGQPVCSGQDKQLFMNRATFLQRDGDDLALVDAAGRCVDYVAYELGWNLGARIAPPADCVWSGDNPGNGNQAGVSVSRFDAEPIIDTDSDSDWERSGASATRGSGTPAAANQ